MMFDSELIQYGVFGTLALSIGVIVYVLIYPFISGERKTDQRIKTVSRRPSGRQAGKKISDGADRRKKVQETLKEIEDKQKEHKQKLSMAVLLVQAGLDISIRTYYLACAITGLMAAAGAMVAGTPMLVVAGAGLAGSLGLPRWIVLFLRKRRFKKFLGEFPNAIDIVVRGVKSGLPFGDTVRIIASESPEPIRSEFREIVEGQAVGLPIAEGLERMYARVPLAEVNFLAIVVTVQQSAGGNLAEALSNLSRVLRERKKLQGKIQSMSQEAKSSAAIIGALPLGVMGVVYMTTPEYISLLWETKMGQIMMLGSAVWMLIGVFVMKKMINFDY